MKVSVAMATYNGENYLKEQIESIINQLGNDDELIISDDGSTDGTVAIIKSYLEDPRIKFFTNPGNGVIQNFENAIRNTSNDVIFLSDQDDVWLPNKVQFMLKEFKNPKVNLVISEAKFVNFDLNVTNNTTSYSIQWKKGAVNNFIKNTYIGCCMAFRKDIKEFILPFPKNIPMHDVWIGILCEMSKFEISHLPNQLILYRRHNNTATNSKRNNFRKILYWRLVLSYNLAKRFIKSRGLN